MEDEIDADAYGDDFSESGHYASMSNDQEDDEQHAQKVNGKVENLEVLLDELRNELTSEKLEHSKTLTLLQEANLIQEISSSSSKVGREKETSSGGEERPDPLDIAFHGIGVEVGRKKQAKSAKMGGNEISSFLILELADFFKFCTSKSIKMGKSIGIEEFDENYCVGALRLARKGIASQMRKLSEFEKGAGTWTGGRSTPPENDLITRISNLQIELLVAQKAKGDIKAMKIKLMLMVDKMRLEQDIRLRHSEDMLAMKKKLLMLSDHTEKLMNHLRIEATTKLRIVEHLRISERSNRKLADNVSISARKSSAKDRLILELREGSKILEDQLRLMDEKYLELRSKLDYARESGMKKLIKADKTARDLRLKFAMAGSGAVLDRVALPEILNDGMLAYSDYLDQNGQDPSATFLGTYNGGHVFTANGNTGNSAAKSGKFRSKNCLYEEKSDADVPDPMVKEISMNDVLEKIRRNRGDKQTWTDDKLRQLTKSR